MAQRELRVSDSLYRSSLWLHFHKQMFIELDRQMRIVSRHRSQVFSGDIVHYTVVATFEAAQFDWSLPLLGKKGVVHDLILADDMRLRHIEADVIELSEILSL